MNRTNAIIFVVLIVGSTLGYKFGELRQAKHDANKVFIAEYINQEFVEMERASHDENYDGHEMIRRHPWGDMHKQLAAGKIVYVEMHFTGPDEMSTRIHRAYEAAMQWKKDHPEAYRTEPSSGTVND